MSLEGPKSLLRLVFRSAIEIRTEQVRLDAKHFLLLLLLPPFRRLHFRRTQQKGIIFSSVKWENTETAIFFFFLKLFIYFDRYMFLSSCAPFGTDANNIRALRVLILFHNEKEMDWGHKRSPPYSFYFLFFICMWWDLYFPVVAKSMAVYAPAVPFVSGWKIRTHAHLRRDESLVSIEAKWEEGDYCNKGKKKKNLRRCVLLLARGRCQKSSSHWGGWFPRRLTDVMTSCMESACPILDNLTQKRHRSNIPLFSSLLQVDSKMAEDCARMLEKKNFSMGGFDPSETENTCQQSV